MSRLANIPHPFPYQGSKRGIAKHILPHFPPNVDRLIEPFCGAGAVSIAAAARGLARRFVINDINKPLMDLWREILQRPNALCDEYQRQWQQQQTDKKAHFFAARERFNQTGSPHLLLYLLARIVKGSVRYGANGRFNQSADNRRMGMTPAAMRKNICGVAALLANKTTVSAADFRRAAGKAKEADLVYMDPPYQGTSAAGDRRYFSGLEYGDFADALADLNRANISFIVSYDGATGGKTHGKPLPASLALRRLHICAGRSTQATLLGGNDKTIESLYLSPALTRRLRQSGAAQKAPAKPPALCLCLGISRRRRPIASV